MKRAAGILLHPTSLPSPYGIGDFGDNAYTWIRLLKNAGISHWQYCPIGPTTDGDSPYQSLCSFAGNPILISPQKLFESGLLTTAELAQYPRSADPEKVNFSEVFCAKDELFTKAFVRFKPDDAFAAFCEKERYWLDDYAVFCVMRSHTQCRAWNTWESGIRMRDPQAIESLKKQNAEELSYHMFLQYIFTCQFESLKAFAGEMGVVLVGDVPIYVALDSSDTWAMPSQFELDETGDPLRVSGVPPDYFCEDGQLWGNPLYKWDNMKKDGYRWWIERLKKALQYANIVRLDHFRGFQAYWAIDAKSETAKNGVWEKGPGMDLFTAVKNALGGLPFIAEDLGDITPAVDKLRTETGLPGMRVLQFAFDGNPNNPHLPYAMSQNSVVYTGTHDNTTTAGWLETLSGVERQRVDEYCGCEGGAGVEDIVRCAFAAPSDLCVVPMQDVVGQGAPFRMNVPGTARGNWRYRVHEKYMTDETFAKVKDFALIYGRANR